VPAWDQRVSLPYGPGADQATTIWAGCGAVWRGDSLGALVLGDREGIGLRCPVGRFPLWEGLEGRAGLRLVASRSGLGKVRLREGRLGLSRRLAYSG
jgi:hypothetical protein